MDNRSVWSQIRFILRFYQHASIWTSNSDVVHGYTEFSEIIVPWPGEGIIHWVRAKSLPMLATLNMGCSVDSNTTCTNANRPKCPDRNRFNSISRCNDSHSRVDCSWILPLCYNFHHDNVRIASIWIQTPCLPRDTSFCCHIDLYYICSPWRLLSDCSFVMLCIAVEHAQSPHERLVLRFIPEEVYSGLGKWNLLCLHSLRITTICTVLHSLEAAWLLHLFGQRPR